MKTDKELYFLLKIYCPYELTKIGSLRRMQKDYTLPEPDTEYGRRMKNKYGEKLQKIINKKYKITTTMKNTDKQNRIDFLQSLKKLVDDELLKVEEITTESEQYNKKWKSELISFIQNKDLYIEEVSISPFHHQNDPIKKGAFGGFITVKYRTL